MPTVTVTSGKDDVSETTWAARAEAVRVLAKYPARVPVIIRPQNADDPSLAKERYLVPRDITCAELLLVLRNHIEVRAADGLFLFVETCICQGQRVGEIYERYRDADTLFLHLILGKESTFGSTSDSPRLPLLPPP